MNKKVTWYLCILFFITGVLGCSDPDILYTVTITEIQKNKEAYYCVYRITQDIESEPKLPEPYFVDTCDKYKVGDTITLSR